MALRAIHSMVVAAALSNGYPAAPLAVSMTTSAGEPEGSSSKRHPIAGSAAQPR